MPAPNPVEPLWIILGPKIPTASIVDEFDQTTAMAQLQEEKPICFQFCRFPLGLNLSSIRKRSAVVFRNCEFGGLVNLTDAKFKQSVTFEDCLFKQSLTLRGAHVEGSLCLEGSILGLPENYRLEPFLQRPAYEPPPAFRSAQWDSLCVEGHLNANRILVFGSVDLGHAEIHGSLMMKGCRIGCGPYGGRLYVRQARIDGDVEFSPWTWERQLWTDPPHSSKGDASASKELYKQGEKHVVQPQWQVDNWQLLRSKWHSSEGLPSIRFGDQDQTHSCDDEVKEHLASGMPPEESGKKLGRRTIIRGSLSIGASIIKGRVNLRGARIHEALHAITVQVFNRLLADCWIHPDAVDQVAANNVECCSGAFLQTEIGWDGKTPLPEAGLGHQHTPDYRSVYLQDAVIEEAVWLKGARCHGPIDMENIRIGGELNLAVWEPADWRKTTISLRSRTEIQESHAKLAPTETLGDKSLILKNAKVTAGISLDGALLHGCVDATSCHIGASVKVRAFQDTFNDWPTTIGKTKKGNSIELYGARIDGSVLLDGAQIKGGVNMRYAVVNGLLTAMPWRPPNATDAPYRFTSIGTEEFDGGLYSLNLYGAAVGGNICLEAANLNGALWLQLANIKGAVVCKKGRHAQERPFIGAHRIRSANQLYGPDNANERSVAVSHSRDSDPQSINLFGARVGNRVEISGYDLKGGLEAQGLDVQEGFSAEPMKGTCDDAGDQRDCLDKFYERHATIVHGDVVLVGAIIHGAFEVRRLQVIGGCIDATEMQVGLHGKFGGCNVSEDILLTDAHFKGEVSFGDPTCGDIGDEVLENRGTFVGKRFSLRRTEIGGTVSLHNAVVGAECCTSPNEEISPKSLLGLSFDQICKLPDCLWRYRDGISIPKAPSDAKGDASTLDGIPVFDLHQAQIGGSVRTALRSKLGTLSSTGLRFHLRVNGRTDAEGVHVKGKCHLFAVLFCGGVSFDHASFDSDLDIANSVVGGNLNMQNVRVRGSAFDTRITMNQNASVPTQRAGAAVSLRPSQRTSKTPIADSGPLVLGEVNLRNSVLRDICFKYPDLESLSSDKNAIGKGGGFALAPTHICLERARVGSILFEGSFVPRANPTLSIGGLEFEDLDVTKLKEQQHPSRTLTQLSYPQQIVSEPGAGLKLTSIFRVLFLRWRDLASWICQVRIFNQNRFHLWGHAHKYNLLLAQTPDLDESSYDSVERYLRKQGLDDEANDVYLERNIRELLHGDIGWIPYLLKAVFNVFTGSGVRAHRLFFILLIWWFVSSCIFMSPDSVERPPNFVVPFENTLRPSEPVQWSQVKRDKPRKVSPEDTWDLRDGVWVAFNVHIPVLHFWARDEWEPSSDEFRLFWTRGWTIKYETYASIVQIFSYIAIPFLIVGWANKYRRHERR